MNDEFDELAKNMAQSVTRRGALKKFGLGFAGAALASLGLPRQADAGPQLQACLTTGSPCGSRGKCKRDCCSGAGYLDPSYENKNYWFCT